MQPLSSPSTHRLRAWGKLMLETTGLQVAKTPAKTPCFQLGPLHFTRFLHRRIISLRCRDILRFHGQRRAFYSHQLGRVPFFSAIICNSQLARHYRQRWLGFNCYFCRAFIPWPSNSQFLLRWLVGQRFSVLGIFY